MGESREFSPTLLVPFAHGYPLDSPDSPTRQLAVIEAALRILEDPQLSPPVLREFEATAAT